MKKMKGRRRKRRKEKKDFADKTIILYCMVFKA